MSIRRIALAAVALALCVVPALADITYNIVDYPDFQNGYNVSGTITTNGSTGTQLPTKDIIGWNITVSQMGVTQFSLTPANSQIDSDQFDATTSEITVGTLEDRMTFENPDDQDAIHWSNVVVKAGAETDYRAQILILGKEVDLWQTPWPSTDAIAEVSTTSVVPEPSTLLPVGFAAVAGLGVWARKRIRR